MWLMSGCRLLKGTGMAKNKTKKVEAEKKPEIFSREFPYARPRRWKHKENGNEVKVIPWFVPVDNSSKFDFKGLMKEIEPGLFTDDVLGEFEVYSGLVMSFGWLMENAQNVWIGMPRNSREYFDDVGPWFKQEKDTQK